MRTRTALSSESVLLAGQNFLLKMHVMGSVKTASWVGQRADGAKRGRADGPAESSSGPHGYPDMQGPILRRRELEIIPLPRVSRL